MATRPFRLCTAADLAAAQAHASAVLNAWVGDWIGSARRPLFQLDCKPASPEQLEAQAADGLWLRCLGASGAAWASSHQVQATASMLFGCGSPSGDSAATRIGQQALSSLLRRLASCSEHAAEMLAVEHAPPRHLGQPGRLAMVLTTTSPQSALTVWIESIPSNEIRATPERKPTLASTKDGIRSQQVTLTAWLGEAEVELGLLRNLAVGDVLQLDRRLTERVDLKVGNDHLPCAGHLCALEGQMTIEVSRL